MSLHSPLYVALFSALLTVSVGAQAENKSAESEKVRAEKATDELDKDEENSQMPLPGQGYSHSSLLLDEAKEKEAIDEKLETLKKEGKVVEPAK